MTVPAPAIRGILATAILSVVPALGISAQSAGDVLWHQKVSAAKGNGPLGIKTNDQFARGSAVIGDVDGDGVPDLAVGALGDDDNEGNDALDYGACWILFMNTDGTVKGHHKISRSSAGLPLDPGDEFGRAVRELGDFNLDGVPDIMVSADKDDDNGTNKGALYLLFLDTDGSVKEWKKISETTGGFGGDLDSKDLFGRGMRNLGDLDLDGVPDIGVGAPWDDDGGRKRGAYWILFMNRDGTVKDWSKLSDKKGGFDNDISDSAEFGFDCAVIGDRNGDGIQDIAISSPDLKTDGEQQGGVFIVYLNRDGTAKHDFLITENYAGFDGDMLDYNDEFGSAIECIGDLDGDGNLDLAVGVGKDDDGPAGSFDRGAVYVLLLNADATVKSWQKISRVEGNFKANVDNADRFGTSLCAPGDLNGDGIPDLFSGARFDDDGGSGAGALYFLALNDGTLVPPTAKFLYDPRRGRAPHTVNFTDLSTGDVSSWLWDFGDGTTSTQQSPSHAYQTTGFKDVSLTVSGIAGSDERFRKRIIKIDMPFLPDASFEAQATFGMFPLEVQFEDDSTGLITSWSWDLGDGGTSLDQSPLYVYETPGTYTVELTVGNENGLDTLTRFDLVVVTAVPPPTPDFDAAGTVGIIPFDVSFADLSQGDVTAWSWDFGDGSSSGEQNPTHTFTQAGLYTVALSASGPGGTGTETRVDLVLAQLPPAPVAGFTTDLVGGLEPLDVSFTDLTSGDVTSWSWSFGDGSVASNPSPTHTYPAGVYTVSLTVTGPGGSHEFTQIDLIQVIGVVRGLQDPSFEEQLAGELPGGAWSLIHGDEHLIESAVDGSLPSDGQQWLRLSSAGTQDTVPPSTPGAETLPALGAAGIQQSFRLEDPFSVLEFDAAFALGGRRAHALDNDWMSIDVSDGTTTVNLYYADSYSSMAGLSQIAGVQRTAVQSASADLRELFPDSSVNTLFHLTIQVGNGGPDHRTSFALVDDLRLAQASGTVLRYGCDPNVRGSLSILSGEARLGETLMVGVDNPLGTMGPNSSAFLWLSLAPDPATPCGTPTPGYGMDGGDGEILVQRTGGQLLKTIAGGKWSTPGEPALVPLAMPSALSWIGRSFYLQGYLIDPRETHGVRFGVTDALEVVVGP